MGDGDGLDRGHGHGCQPPADSGATVTAKSPALQLPSVSVVTGPDGAYRLQTLPAGTYEVTYDLTGFQRVIRQGLRVDAGFVAKIDIELKVGQLEESLTVVGQTPVVDVKTTGSQVTFSEATLENVPVTRTMWQVLAMTPGVRMNAFDIGGQLTGTQTSVRELRSGGPGRDVARRLRHQPRPDGQQSVLPGLQLF